MIATTSLKLPLDSIDPYDRILSVRPSRLEGNVQLSGAKNSVLRLMAASLLTGEEVTLTNYPDTLLDVGVHEGMLEALGKKIVRKTDQATIKEPVAPIDQLIWDGRSIRNTLLILGALTTRLGRGKVPLPGGCRLGERKYDIHVMALERLGARVWEEGDYLCTEVASGRLRGTDIHLPLRSTGATENSILMATLAEGTTRIWNPHVRPEIIDLIALLKKMGADIEVRGQESIIVKGREGLRGCRHHVIPDNMEAITWAIGAAMTGGEIEIMDFPEQHLEVPLAFLRESGMKYYRGSNSLIVRGSVPYPVEISTGPYPGINSDMQPLFAVYGAQAQGTSKIIDLRFAGRYGYAEELAKMGMRYSTKGQMLIIEGSQLQGAVVRALDLRAGMALTLAGLVANKGETEIHDVWQIERGYHRFYEKLISLGGDINLSSK